MLQAAVRHGRARQSSGRGQCGDCIRVLWVSSLWDQYSEKLRFIGKPGVQDKEGHHVAKRSSDPRVTNPEVKVQVQDLTRAVGIAAPFAPRGSVRGKNSFYRDLGDKLAQETCALCPLLRYVTVEPGKIQGRDRMGFSIRKKNRFIEKPGGRHEAKRSSDPKVAYTEVKVQVRDIVWVVGIVAPLPHGVTVPRKNSFYPALGGKRAHLCRVPPPPPSHSSFTPRESQAKFRDVTVWGLCRWVLRR